MSNVMNKLKKIKLDKKNILSIIATLIIIIGVFFVYQRWTGINGIWKSDVHGNATELNFKGHDVVVTDSKYGTKPTIGTVDKFKQTIVFNDKKHIYSDKSKFVVKYKMMNKKLIIVSDSLDGSYHKK